MTPKEKAVELVSKFRNEFKWVEEYHNVDLYRDTRQCALIAVDEILKSFEAFMDSRRNFRHELEIDAERYWQSVKKEIELL